MRASALNNILFNRVLISFAALSIYFLVPLIFEISSSNRLLYIIFLLNASYSFAKTVLETFLIKTNKVLTNLDALFLSLSFLSFFLLLDRDWLLIQGAICLLPSIFFLPRSIKLLRKKEVLKSFLYGSYLQVTCIFWFIAAVKFNFSNLIYVFIAILLFFQVKNFTILSNTKFSLSILFRQLLTPILVNYTKDKLNHELFYSFLILLRGFSFTTSLIPSIINYFSRDFEDNFLIARDKINKALFKLYLPSTLFILLSLSGYLYYFEYEISILLIIVFSLCSIIVAAFGIVQFHAFKALEDNLILSLYISLVVAIIALSFFNINYLIMFLTIIAMPRISFYFLIKKFDGLNNRN